MRSGIRGFTLVELMITLIVFAVVLGIAIPNFQNYILQNRVKTGAQELFSALNYARSEAVKLDADVYVTPADENHWQKGWIVTDMADRTYSECQNGKSNCLRVQPPLSELTITTSDDEVVYGGNGRTGVQTQFQFCTAANNASVQQRVVSTDLSGRPRIEFEGDCS